MKRLFCFGNFQGKLVGFKPGCFLSSAFIVSKRFSIFEPEINKFVSSANIIRVSLFQLVKRSFIYMRNKSGPRMEPCGKPQVIREHILFSYLLSHTNCC